MFRDITGEVGLTLANDQACWVDINADGWCDLITGGVVWRNEKGQKFSKFAEGVGSVVAADFDNDGRVDMFSFSLQKMFRNEGTKFTEVPIAGLPATVSRSACWLDYDKDAFVDVFVGGYEDWEKNVTYPSYLLKNVQGKRFEVVWKRAEFRTRGVTACDFNREGLMEVYASNYRLQPNNLFSFYPNGQAADLSAGFNALATSAGFAGGHSIGAAWGDFDGDGEFDLFAGNFAHVDSRGDQPKSRFLRNMGIEWGFRFHDRGECGVWYQESYASPAAADVDNDGSLDLFLTTVYGTASFNKPNFPIIFRNEGGFKFKDMTEGSGLEKLPPTYQAAFADFRNDGRVGLATGGKLFANQSPAQHWLEVRLEGDGKKVNRSAIGAQVRVRLKDKTLARQVEAGTGEGNQNDLRLHFGLGDTKGPVDVEIYWPGVGTQIVKDVKIDRVVEVRYP